MKEADQMYVANSLIGLATLSDMDKCAKYGSLCQLFVHVTSYRNGPYHTLGQ